MPHLDQPSGLPQRDASLPAPGRANSSPQPTSGPPQNASFCDVNRSSKRERRWLNEAIAKVKADMNRSADTHLLPVRLPAKWGVDLYLKDESTHPSGSLKHRLARSLFLYALANGWLREGVPVVEASSGSTAVSEAYFARMLGLPFIAVMPKTTSREKIQLIERQGGTCHLVEPDMSAPGEAMRLADTLGGHYMDQFTYAERATDWRGNNNIAESVFLQMSRERFPIPTWVVVGAGTGGTSATFGRFLRYQGCDTQLCVVDPENSAFFPGWREMDPELRIGTCSRIEGIGRNRTEASFIPSVVDRMMRVPDAASIATIHWLRDEMGILAGGSTGTNLFGSLRLICEMVQEGRTGSVVTLLCDKGDRYLDTYYNQEWLDKNDIDPKPFRDIIDVAYSQAQWEMPPS